MAGTTPTVKSVTITNEDKYRKEKMIAWLIARGMLTTEAENYIRKGKR